MKLVYLYKTNCKNDQNLHKIHLLRFRLNFNSGDQLKILLWTPSVCKIPLKILLGIKIHVSNPETI